MRPLPRWVDIALSDSLAPSLDGVSGGSVPAFFRNAHTASTYGRKPRWSVADGWSELPACAAKGLGPTATGCGCGSGGGVGIGAGPGRLPPSSSGVRDSGVPGVVWPVCWTAGSAFVPADPGVALEPPGACAGAAPADASPSPADAGPPVPLPDGPVADAPPRVAAAPEAESPEEVSPGTVSADDAPEAEPVRVPDPFFEALRAGPAFVDEAPPDRWLAVLVGPSPPGAVAAGPDPPEALPAPDAAAPEEGVPGCVCTA